MSLEISKLPVLKSQNMIMNHLLSTELLPYLYETRRKSCSRSIIMYYYNKQGHQQLHVFIMVLKHKDSIYSCRDLLSTSTCMETQPKWPGFFGKCNFATLDSECSNIDWRFARVSSNLN